MSGRSPERLEFDMSVTRLAADNESFTVELTDNLWDNEATLTLCPHHDVSRYTPGTRFTLVLVEEGGGGR